VTGSAIDTQDTLTFSVLQDVRPMIEYSSRQKILPEFARACRTHDTPAVIMRRYALAADYQEEEYHFIGMAINSPGFAAKKSTFAVDGEASQ
jgi:hypothetical protein